MKALKNFHNNIKILPRAFSRKKTPFLPKSKPYECSVKSAGHAESRLGSGWAVKGQATFSGVPATPLPNQGSKSEKKVVTLGRGGKFSCQSQGRSYYQMGAIRTTDVSHQQLKYKFCDVCS